MPPPKTLFADPERILVSIYHESEALVAELDERIRKVYGFYREHLQRDLENARAGWIKYSLPLFSGRDDLSESAKQIWRRAVRQLEADGLVERDHPYIRLTEAGRSKLGALVKMTNV